MHNEDGLPLEKEQAFTYLGVPHSKAKGFFWVPVPAYTADAIEVWEKERASQQDQQVDSKDNSLCNFLFMHRNTKMGLNFLNAAVIPLLCAKAGVPVKDARGTITSHRGRSTIATILRQKGVSLEDIAQFLGHANTRTVSAYARTDPFQFAVNISKANDMLRIVEGLIDTRAARQGEPNVFFSLGRGADGKPRFCGNPAWAACPHRFACLKCDMYVGSGQAERLAERAEARDEIIRFQTEMPMTEQAAARGDIEKLNELIMLEQQVPPPEAPSTEFCFNRNEQLVEAPLSSEKDDATAQELGLERQLRTLKQKLAEAEKHHNGRNVFVKSLKKQIADLTRAIEQIAENYQ